MNAFAIGQNLYWYTHLGAMKARLELYTDAQGTIFDNYDECSHKNHERTHRVELGYHWLQYETTDVTASPRSGHEKQD